ncbi:MAG: DUF4494 domain-containing protein [Muribaculaceae bacterium]|nr:DUF4494 domain-containing protein [Muribaculaceae bacterium]MDD6020740.1 DUF4494 domain-containing protein [bacterium]MDD6027181.1 DUF4494 domain-containing protein [bacterium]
MAQWFECKIKIDKTTADGVIKTSTENYLVDALSFTEAEARITEEMQPYISGEFKVDSVKRVRVSEMFFDETGDRWYKAKVNFVTLDEKKGVEKRTASYMYVQATEFSKALQNLMEGMKGTMSDFEVASITETTLLDVFKEDLTGPESAPQA